MCYNDSIAFSVPTDPIVLASTMNLDDSFSSYQLPAAVLKFRQGFGRLIRSSQDKGIFVLLDSRLYSKKYGQVFENAINEVELLEVSQEDVVKNISNWIEHVSKI